MGAEPKPRTAAKIASGVVFGLVLVLFLGWWGFIRAPGPLDVCEHIIEVTLREAGDEALSDDSLSRLVDSTREQCIEHKRDKIQLRGRIKYAEHAKCVMAAQTLSEIGRC
ncbi:hypothetical protein [Paraliomyxa miuraensis]|uniref:hypothetical protein n=1 Tax=Paraliomyxa miuraensis TaxID=376150 RepID=UPI00225ABB01|nr:hypothetical protein [Paraliomyxa miuraensis]MCX4246853.1 hypothetical protein [Paraliomyxa miuraensis]